MVKKYLFVISSFVIIASGCSSVKHVTEHELSNDDKANYEYLFYEGLDRKLHGNVVEARNAFLNATIINPNSDAAFYELAALHFQYKDYINSYKYSTKAVSLSPENKWYISLLAQSCMATNRVDSAIISYKKLVELSPENVDNIYNLALLYSQVNQDVKALELFRKVLDKYPDNQQLSLMVYELILRVEGSEKALSFLNERIILDSENIKYHLLKAELFVDLNELIQAQEVYDYMFSKFGNDPTISLSYIELAIKQNKISELYDFASNFISSKEFEPSYKIRLLYGVVLRDSVFTDFPRVQTFVEDLKSIYANDSRVYDISSIFYLKRENVDSALVDLQKYIDLDKTNALVWNRLFSVLEYKADWKSIEKYGELAIDNSIQSPQIYYLLGLSKMFLEKNVEAINLLEKYIVMDEVNSINLAAAYSLLGDLCYKTNDSKRAFEYYELSLKQNNDNIYVLNNYSYYLSEEGLNLEYALKLSKQTIDKEPLNATYLDTYAWILYKLERYQQALVFIQKAITNSSEASSELYYHQGMIMYKNSMFIEAKKSFDEAKKLGKIGIDDLYKKLGL